MMEINQGIFCTLFQNFKNFEIQLFPVIFRLILSLNFQFSPVYFLSFFYTLHALKINGFLTEGELGRHNFSPQGSLAENGGRKYL